MKNNTEAIKKGDTVEHCRFGRGKVLSVDANSYSIPMVVFFSEKLQDEICRAEGEFVKETVTCEL